MTRSYLFAQIYIFEMEILYWVPCCFMGSFALAVILAYWISLLSLIALIIMGIDKLAARFHRRRISEAVLWLLSIVGGFPGIILGALLFHHKVRKRSFWIPVAIGIALWALIFLYEG